MFPNPYVTSPRPLESPFASPAQQSPATAPQEPGRPDGASLGTAVLPGPARQSAARTEPASAVLQPIVRPKVLAPMVDALARPGPIARSRHWREGLVDYEPSYGLRQVVPLAALDHHEFVVGKLARLAETLTGHLARRRGAQAAATHDLEAIRQTMTRAIMRGDGAALLRQIAALDARFGPDSPREPTGLDGELVGDASSLRLPCELVRHEALLRVRLSRGGYAGWPSLGPAAAAAEAALLGALLTKTTALPRPAYVPPYRRRRGNTACQAT